MGTEIVDIKRYDVTTHDSWRSPPRAPTIVGNAVATMVWSRDANSIPAMRPRKISWIWRWVKLVTAAGAAVAPTPSGAGAVVVTNASLSLRVRMGCRWRWPGAPGR